MDPLAFLLVVASVTLALAVGFVGARLGRGGEAGVRFDEAAREAEAAAARADAEAEAFRQTHVQTARAELEAGRAEIRREEARLATRRTEAKASRRRARETLDARRAELDRQERRLAAREAALLEAADAVDALTVAAARRQSDADALFGEVRQLADAVALKEHEANVRGDEVEALRAEATAEADRLRDLAADYVARLERSAELGRDEARDELVREMTRAAELEAADAVHEAREAAQRTAARDARHTVLKAIQRLAATATIEHTTSAVPLASENLKGRVIGREGRNIRAFEAATGVEVIVDDTPDAVLVSGFDPVRREVARLALVRLLEDGRIHPARIEEVVAATREEIEAETVRAGEEAALELRVHGLHPALIRLVGRMKYRSSYGQNLLQHSVEVAKLAGFMAAELGLDARKAKRAGLLHDIGKVVEGDLESPHAIAGMELARQHGEHPDVANAVGAHHDEVPMAAHIAPLVQAADAASGARPGARRETLERYVQRLRAIEDIASGFGGVEQAYAIQAGREVRVVVDTDRVSDATAEALAHDISRRIEHELDYPGQITVTVIREVRATAVAR